MCMSAVCDFPTIFTCFVDQLKEYSSILNITLNSLGNIAAMALDITLND